MNLYFKVAVMLSYSRAPYNKTTFILTVKYIWSCVAQRQLLGTVL